MDDLKKERIREYKRKWYLKNRPRRFTDEERRAKIVAAKTIHGAAKNGVLTPEYRTWRKMKERCLCQTNPSYPLYGGRGITICDRWLEFKNFLEDMGERPPGMSIDRIDNNAGYSPENCRWATNKQQARNKRNNRIISAFGKTMTLSEWAEAAKMPMKTLHNRINKHGWSFERALFYPVRGK